MKFTKKTRLIILFCVITALLVAIGIFLYKYTSGGQCLPGKLSNSCMYRNAPLLPPGQAY